MSTNNRLRNRFLVSVVAVATGVTIIYQAAHNIAAHFVEQTADNTLMIADKAVRQAIQEKTSPMIHTGQTRTVTVLIVRFMIPSCLPIKQTYTGTRSSNTAFGAWGV
jgi:hypothetical protein